MSVRALSVDGGGDDDLTRGLASQGWDRLAPAALAPDEPALFVQQFGDPDAGDQAVEAAGVLLQGRRINLINDADGWITWFPAPPLPPDPHLIAGAHGDLTELVQAAVAAALAAQKPPVTSTAEPAPGAPATGTATSSAASPPAAATVGQPVAVPPTAGAGPATPASPSPAPSPSPSPSPELDPGLLKMAARHPRAAARAWEQVEAVGRARTEMTGAQTWATSPELVLLAMVPEGERVVQADRLLTVMADAREQQVFAASEAVLLAEELRPSRVSLEKARSQAAGYVKDMAGETVEHLKRWRALSKWAPKFMIATVLFAALMTWLVLDGVADEHVDEWAAVALVFVLALFAISPAVLLLLQRPLTGLDQWSPAPQKTPDPAAAGAAPKTPADAPAGAATPTPPAAAGAT